MDEDKNLIDFPMKDRFAFQLSDGKWYNGVEGKMANLAFGFDSKQEALDNLNTLPPSCTCHAVDRKFGQGGCYWKTMPYCPRHGSDPDPRIKNFSREIRLKRKHR